MVDCSATKSLSIRDSFLSFLGCNGCCMIYFVSRCQKCTYIYSYQYNYNNIDTILHYVSTEDI